MVSFWKAAGFIVAEWLWWVPGWYCLRGAWRCAAVGCFEGRVAVTAARPLAVLGRLAGEVATFSDDGAHWPLHCP